MAQSTVTAEQRCLDDAAREYENKGYRVVREPDGAQLPDFFAGVRPDLIAYSDRENVVIEVKLGAALPQSRDMVSLADAVNERPGWRFELIVINSSMREEPAGLDWWEIRRRIADARELVDDQEGAAAVLAWSAAEAIMRLIARREKISLGSTQKDTPLFLVKKLFSLGLLSREDYDVFAEGMQLRNQIVHGYRVPMPIREEVLTLIASIERLLAEITPQSTPSSASGDG